MKKRLLYSFIAMLLCFGIAVLLDFGIKKEDNLETYVQRIEKSLHRKEREATTLLADTSFLLRQIKGIEKLPSWQQDADLKRLLEWTQKDYNILFYQADSLVYWLNNSAYLPRHIEKSLLRTASTPALARLSNGYYVVQRLQLPRQITALTLLPLKWQFPRSSRFLPNAFLTDHLTVSPDVTLQESPTKFPIHTLQGKPVAWLDAKAPAKDRFLLQLIFFIYLLGFIAAGMVINDLAVLLVRRFQPLVGAGFVLGAVIGGRWLILSLGLTKHFDGFQTFSSIFTDPILEGVNSLGELLINIILLVWLMVFFNREFQVKEFSHASPLVRFALSTLNFFSINLGILMVCYIFKSIVLDSSIVFDFENVFNLNSQSVLAMTGVVLLLLALFLFSHRMMLAIHKVDLSKNWRLAALGTSILLSIPIIQNGDFNLPLPYFLIAATIYLIVFEFFIEVRTITLGWLAVCLMLYAGLTSMLLYKYNSDKDYLRRQEYARLLTNYQDEDLEASLSFLAARLQSGPWLTNLDALLQKSASGLLLRDEAADLVGPVMNSSKYLVHNYRFEVSGYFADSGKTAIQGQQMDLQTMESRFGRSTATKVTHLRFDEEEPAYLMRLTINASRPLILFISFKRAFSSPSKVYTELLLGKTYKDLTELDNYDYGIYKNGQLIEEYKKPYSKQLTDSLPAPGDFTILKHTSTRSELLYHAKNNIAIKIGRETGGYIKPLSLFSYVFTLLTIAVLSVAAFNYYVNALPGPLNFLRNMKRSLRNQFQFRVISMILVSFLGIGFVTVMYFQESSNDYNKGQLNRKVTSALASVNYEIKNIYKQQQRNQATTISEDAADGQPGNQFPIASLIPLISEVHRLDVNLYDLQGNLIFSSEEDIFREGLISRKMGSYAYQAIRRLGYDRCDQDERIGNLKYTAAYLPLLDGNNQPIALIGIPYYSQHRELSKDVANFMSTLLNVYVFLLLIAGGLAIVVANSVTRALSELSENIQRLRPGNNQPLVWKRKDEIGDLVEAYNQALTKIEESSRLLAQSEREDAWREMAKQVAHEIKNPLTPMKLSIQYLQHAYQSDSDPAKIEPLLKRVSDTLVEQIDSLSQIATAFSNFAKMPKAQNIGFSLNHLVASVHHLFRNERPDMTISLRLPREEYEVFADKNQIIQVLNNLFKNAIQAIPDDREGIVQIMLYQRGGFAVIEVKDNGAGIPPEIQEKVFFPNFSTKTSGTGLGLAICKNIIEGFDGRIYFETQIGIGTSFFVELPIMDIRSV